MDMDKRNIELLALSSFIKTVDNDVTMILQSLQWDRKRLLEAPQLSSCKYDRNHRMPPVKLDDHEKECFLRSLGYTKEDLLLPEPFDADAHTLVKLNKDDVANIIEYAAKFDPGFRRGRGPGPVEPLSLDRLQYSYTTDERRALHDAAVSAAPACHDLEELALLGGDEKVQIAKPKSRAEILAELRDMKRRRTKYRGAGKTRNYSDVLRDVIASQMELYDTRNTNQADDCNNSDKSARNKTREQGETYIKEEPLERDKTYPEDRETRRDSTKDYDNDHRQRSRDETRQRSSRSDIRHREYSKHETRHRDNFRDEARSKEYPRGETRYRENSRGDTRHNEYSSDKRHMDRARDKYKERENKYEENSRNERDDRRHRLDRDGQSSSNARYIDKNNYKTSDRYKDDTRESRKAYKEYKSRESDVRYKREDSHEKSYRENKRKSYESKQYEYDVHKRIKQEKD